VQHGNKGGGLSSIYLFIDWLIDWLIISWIYDLSLKAASHRSIFLFYENIDTVCKNRQDSPVPQPPEQRYQQSHWEEHVCMNKTCMNTCIPTHQRLNPVCKYRIKNSIKTGLTLIIERNLQTIPLSHISLQLQKSYSTLLDVFFCVFFSSNALQS